MALAFTEDDLLRAAGAKSFERGLGYVTSVEELEIEGTEIDAIVTGSFDYDVTLSRERGRLVGECSCPWSQEGNFCKHCVAVGLAALGARRPGAAVPAARLDFDAWLEQLGAEELRAELRALVRADRELRRRFELRAAQANEDAGLVRTLVRRLLRVGPRGYIEYEDAHDYAANVREAAEAISTLIDKGRAAESVEIVREAIDEGIDALDSADDADGAIAEAVAALRPLHLRACEQARPEHATLAQYLAEHNLAEDDGFGYDLAQYAAVLGEDGIGKVHDAYRAAYRRNPKGARERQLMEELIRAAGGVDELVALLARDLDSRGYQHLRIAQELEAAGRAEEGLGWAETGLREATGFIGTDLVEFVALRYTQDGRMDDLLTLRRGRFTAEMTVSHYELLREQAQRCGVWPDERERAMVLLRDDLAKQGPKARYGMGPVLIDVLIAEGAYEAAWEQTRKASSEPQRLKLAALIRAERPAEALEVYEHALAPLRAQTGEDAYYRAMELLQGIRTCYALVGREGEFAIYLRAFRQEQRRKRKLLALLDAAGLVETQKEA
jgi:uncharacterized Zn finger protein